MSRQCTSTVLMIRPAHFGYNAETAKDNHFQSKPETLSAEEIKKRAVGEFEEMVKMLRNYDVEVFVVEDSDEPVKPDAVFPNNWVSFHSNGAAITYALKSGIRRKERQESIVEKVMKEYGFDRRYSLEQYEKKSQFLEGTGSMVLDRDNEIVYACISERTNPLLLDKFCALTGYDRLVFLASDRDGKAIYHTNVMMSVGESFVIICMDSVQNERDRTALKQFFERTGKQIIEINQDQMEAFAGNMLQMRSKEGALLLVMSKQAFVSLTPEQVESLKPHGTLVYSDLSTIETYGGGSARCMLAEIFAPNLT